ncbi:50S ribosomal protein L23 [Candidatus Woesearchaeota archaeon]|nr:50S ribosomal protein L23 [Candidatus Woesearchaeota archaeon]
MSANPYDVVMYPLSSEKSLRMMEAHNKLIFVVKLTSNKHDIKDAIQTMFKAKVTCVHTKITPRGDKHAIVTFAKDSPAIDIATNLGLM